MNIAKEEYNEGTFFSISRSNHWTRVKRSGLSKRKKETKRLREWNGRKWEGVLLIEGISWPFGVRMLFVSLLIFSDFVMTWALRFAHPTGWLSTGSQGEAQEAGECRRRAEYGGPGVAAGPNVLSTSAREHRQRQDTRHPTASSHCGSQGATRGAHRGGCRTNADRGRQKASPNFSLPKPDWTRFGFCEKRRRSDKNRRGYAVKF